jgi:hypothetical protein
MKKKSEPIYTYKQYYQDRYIEESKYMIDGINYDIVNKIIDLNNIDASTIIKPTYSKIDDIDVISIFKRKVTDAKPDGNLLLYALKNINGWTINKDVIINLLSQFVRTSEKIKSKYDTVITVSSISELNEKFLYHLYEIIDCDNIITEGIVTNLDTATVQEHIDYSSMSKEESNTMKEIIKNMSDIFTFKDVSVDLRKYFKNMWDSDYVDSCIKYADKINGKDILILDDTITSDKSVSGYCKSLLELYDPKSATVITLFSKLE